MGDCDSNLPLGMEAGLVTLDQSTAQGYCCGENRSWEHYVQYLKLLKKSSI